ncbi:MAG: AgmX/PglI C-terminal domain-containing protein [Pseudomonadota bacterium]
MKRPLVLLGLAAAVALFAFLLLHRGPASNPEVLDIPPPLAAKVPAPPGASREAQPPPAAPADEPPRKRHRRRHAASQPTAPTALAQEPPSAQGGEAPTPAREPTVWPASADGIHGAMREALPGIRRCYEQALAQDPSIAGKITVVFTVGTTDTAPGLGQVLSAGIQEATIQQTTMDGCLLEAMEALQFDPPVDGDMEVVYPFTFSQG